MRHKQTVPTLRPQLRPADFRTAAPPAKTVDPELQTADHRAWSLEVRKRAGWKCEECGAKGVRLFADHRIERQDGGSRLDPANGRALCGACHTRKTTLARAARMGLV